MADAQIAIIDGDQTQVVLAPGENPAIVTSIPGPQGPAGAGVPLGGTTNQVLFKQSGTNYDTAWGPITSAMIGDLEIVNADVSASAAIAGTKISPDFGSQNVTTTGTSTAASFIPTSSTAPTNGLYLSAANSVALSTNGTGRLFIDANGDITSNTSPSTGLGVRLYGTATGTNVDATTSRGVSLFLHQTSNTNNNASAILFANALTNTGAYIAGQYTSHTNRQTALVFGTGDNAAPTERLRITSAGLVGIGTSSPSSILHCANAGTLQATIQNTAASLTTFLSSGSSAGGVGTSTNHPFDFFTNNQFRARIDSSGRVGIGTQSPSELCEVSGGNLSIYHPSSGNGAGYSLLFKSNGGTTGATLAQVIASQAGTNVNTANLRFLVANAGTLSEALRITSAGLVGIGTSAPSVTFEVASATDNTEYMRVGPLSSASTRSLRFSAEASSGGTSNTTHIINAPSTAGVLKFQTNSTTAVTIDASQRVGIGTTSPAAPLDVNAGAQGTHAIFSQVAGRGLELATTTVSGTSAAGIIYNIRGASSGTHIFQTDGNERLRITSTGSIGVGTASPASTLHINGQTTAYGNGSASLFWGNTSTLGALTYSGTTAIIQQNTTADGLAFWRGTTEQARIDSSGRLLVGTSSARSNFAGNTATPLVQIEGVTAATASSSVVRGAADATGPTFNLGKTRGASVGLNTAVVSGDQCGVITFQGADGTNLLRAAQIEAAVDTGTVSGTSMPGRLTFFTTSDASASPTERLRITSAGVLQVADAGNIAVGTTTGTKIGTATTQKLGFFNKTPVVQPAAVADATDAASVITQLNALLARMRDLGLIAT